MKTAKDEIAVPKLTGRKALPGWLAVLVVVFVIVPMTAVIVWSFVLSKGAWLYWACLAPLEIALIYFVGTSAFTTSFTHRKAPFGRRAAVEKRPESHQP